MPIDSLNLQIFANHCAAAAESMGFTLMRTAYSTFVKETEDFSCQLLTPQGLTFASPKRFGATWFTGLDYGGVIQATGPVEEGDIYLTNDPYSGYVATHSPDTHLWKPVFRNGELMCFVGCHIHNTDIGGAVPASLSRTLTEVHQEGIRIPPMKLISGGMINEDLLRILHTNVRVPEQNRGDLNAQIACVNIGERKVHEIMDRFGMEGFRGGMAQILDYAEMQARNTVRDIPDGRYFFADFADEDSAGGYPCRIALTVEIKGDSVTLDFTGSDPQLASSLNMPTGGNERHALATVGLIYVLHTLDRTILLNAGTARCARAILPSGTVMNAEPPAAVGMRSLLSNLCQTVTFGAFVQAVPDRLPASPASAVSLVNVKTSDRAGRTVMASVGPVGGGAGGGPRRDGIDGSGANNAFLRNTPIEISEAEIPIKFLRYALVPDSAGPGLWRGGLAAAMEFQLFAPHSMVTARNRDRSRFCAWGVLGGGAGQPSSFVKNPDSSNPVDLGNTDIVPCDPGDIIRLIGPGAGGYGDPYGRPAESVMIDVRRGVLSAKRAREDYGVVLLPDLQIDEVGTAQQRRTTDAREYFFDFGENRRAYDRIWTLERYDVLTSILAGVPVGWRHFVKHDIFRQITSPAPESDSGEQVVEAYRVLSGRHPVLPRFEDIESIGKKKSADFYQP